MGLFSLFKDKNRERQIVVSRNDSKKRRKMYLSWERQLIIGKFQRYNNI